MPIGVPRIVYCWGEEVPAQWTDIYNFIFRRRMVFLMQYLDDELCNQICGLLINIHMEDRSKELEKNEKEEKDFLAKKNASKKISDPGLKRTNSGSSSSARANKKKNYNNNDKSLKALLSSDEDLSINDNLLLEKYTFQKITMEWLNWNAQFFDYSDEPYLFYLAELLSNDFSKNEGRVLYTGNPKEMSKLIMNIKNMTNSQISEKESSKLFDKFSEGSSDTGPFSSNPYGSNSGASKVKHLDAYSPFRLLANFAPNDYSFNQLAELPTDSGASQKLKLLQMVQNMESTKSNKSGSIKKLLSELSGTKFFNELKDHQKLEKSSEKALGQRRLRKEYTLDKVNEDLSSLGWFSENGRNRNKKSSNYLDFSVYNDSYNEFRDYYRRQTEKTLSEEELKKVFVIINSFGGAVGNGVTIHDALQFIKAGSLTLGLGVAASAASLVLSAGNIGERYVTEGCHVMIHQPEGGLQGQASDIWIDSQEIMRIRSDVAEIYSLSTYRPKHKILRDLDRDFYLNAKESIYYGLADEIATNEVMREIMDKTRTVWDHHEGEQQRLLEARESAISASESRNDDNQASN